MLLGMSTAMFAGLRQVDIMDLKSSDDTVPGRKLRRHTRRLGGDRINTIIWFEEVGAERNTSEKVSQVMRSAYKKTMLEYWATLRPEFAERAQHMTKYVKSPDPEQGASRFLEKVRRH
jgi:hypothetical protein